MGGSDNQFIVKATVLFKCCPAPACPGRKGGHQREDLPHHCVIWWRESGWRLMGWKGSRDTADSVVIKEKISQFERNFRRRNPTFLEQVSHSQAEREKQSGYQSSQQDNQENGKEKDSRSVGCNFCSFQGVLALHLKEAQPCLLQYLANRAHKYRGRTRLAIFDLGLVCNFCPNPDCAVDLLGEGVTCLRHIESACKEFYQSEGEHVLQWEQGLSAATLQVKLRNRKNWVKMNWTRVSKTQEYHEELAKMLTIVCQKCAIQGPLLDQQEHRICTPHGLEQPLLAECLQCMNGSMGQELVQEALEMLGELGKPAEHDDTLRMVVLRDDNSERPRVVFVPALFQVDCQSAHVSDDQIDPLSTTVLVPKNPEALDAIGDEASERANVVKKSLEKVAGFFGRRHFLGPLIETLSVLFRRMLAHIRVGQLGMLRSRKRTGKGKIMSRDPPIAAVKARNPHFAETKKFCLTSTCSWSATAQDQRSKESAARLYINGQVRIKVEVTLIQKMATNSPLLVDIIREKMSSAHGPAPLASLAPLVLNYVKAKTKLLMTHIITSTYTNWDLDLRFDEREWTVQLVGYLYCEEFEELNKRIALGEVSERQLATEVRQYLHLLPSTAATRRKLMRDHKVEEGRAEVIEALVRKHQMEGEPKPLSLLTMYTPAGLEVATEEQFLRERAIQLGNAVSPDMDGVGAIVEIMRVLRSEGIGDCGSFDLDDGRIIRDDLQPFFTHDSSINEDLLLYHILIFKTGGNRMWTMARDPGETRIDSYLPDLLDASGLHMSAEISSSGDDFLMPGEGCVSEELKRHLISEESSDGEESERGEPMKLIPSTEDWKEISLLEFVNATLPADKVAPARGSTSQPTIPVVISKDRKLTWRMAVDSDNHSGDNVFEVDGDSKYVRTATDVRVLYEKRPARMDNMCLGQFASEYILLQPSRKGFEKATSSIDEDTQVGADSESFVAGTGLAAPETMKLADGRIMKRRQDGKAVPLLLHSGTISRHGNQLLFCPWRHLEEVTGAQEEEETDDQRIRRLEIFPCSVFPFAEGDGEDESN